MRFGTWSVRSRAGSSKTVARGLGKYELDLAGVQEVRWEKGALNGQMSFIFCTSPLMLLDQIKENEVGGTCGTHERRGMCTRF
jgi:hypothetical protein